MSIFTTEITSDRIPSDNPLHHRLLSAYYLAKNYIDGDVLELGCGEGRGIEVILKKSKTFTAIDKIKDAVDALSAKYPKHNFSPKLFPPMGYIEDKSFDTIISFQVIEHIEDDDLFLNEIFRILRPGGKAIITTPNIKMSLTRNPWHIREYTSKELVAISSKYFPNVKIKGISGNNKVIDYYNNNVKSVQKFKRLDFLNLEKYLPNFIYKIPYELLNRFNRNNLKNNNDKLVSSISYNDYLLVNDNPNNLDLFLILKKDKN